MNEYVSCNDQLSPIDYRCLLNNYPLISCFLDFQFLFKWINYRKYLIFDNIFYFLLENKSMTKSSGYLIWIWVNNDLVWIFFILTELCHWLCLEVISAFPIFLHCFSTGLYNLLDKKAVLKSFQATFKIFVV